MPEFTATNPLEAILLDAQLGQVKPSRLFDLLCASQVFVMLNQPLGAGGAWVEGTELLVLEGPERAPVIAVFTAPERAVMWRGIATGFDHGLLVDFRWVLGGIVNDVGIALNPGSEVGLEMSADMVKKLQASIEAG